ncbi:MAG: hypothetical protein ACLPVY_07405 [Acidimicrobiia bacterium]
MTSQSTRLGLGVGITNPRLTTAKRGIAVEVATRLAAMTDTPVCLVGADPTDRDVDRHLPQLARAWGKPSRIQVTRGPHHVDVATFSRSRICVVSVSDRESLDLVFPTLQERFRFLIVDAPSRAGMGVGIAGVLLDWLDALFVATALDAGELAETRRFVEHLGARPTAQHVDVRVVAIGEPAGRGLARRQLETRLAALPTIGRVPRLGAGVANHDRIADPEHDDAFRPIIRWIIDRQARPARDPVRHLAAEHDGGDGHVANRLYRETSRR